MTILGVADSIYNRDANTFQYNAPGTTFKIFIAPSPMTIVGISGMPVVVGSDGGAVTAKFYKCGSGVAAASGTLLHAGTYDLKGTVDVRQVMVLVTPVSTLQLNAGDSVAVIFTGTTTAAIGVVQVETEPRN